MKVHTQHGTRFQIQCNPEELEDLRLAVNELMLWRQNASVQNPGPDVEERAVRAERMLEALTYIKCPHCPTGRLGEPRSHKMDCTWRDPK
jgi:hypothetical protein